MTSCTSVQRVFPVALWILFFLVTLQGAEVLTVTEPFKELDEASEHKEYYKIFHVEHGYALIGARHYLYNVSIGDMTVNQRHEVFPQDFNFSRSDSFAADLGCGGFPDWIKDMDMCHPYITNVYKLNDNEFKVYASYALSRMELFLRLDMNSNEWTLMPTQEENNMFMTVMFPFQNQSTLRTSDGVNWNGGGVRVYHSLTRVKVSRGPTPADPKHKINAKTAFQIWGDVDAMFDVNFLGGFETDEHVYFAFTEIAHESFNQHLDAQKLTRLLRLCKNDIGNKNSAMEDQEFALFNKVNLNCSGSLHGKLNSNDELFKVANRVVLTVPFNIMTGMTTLGNGSVRPHSNQAGSTQKLFYGVFSAADGAQPASAICAFTLEDVEKAFQSHLFGELRLPITQKYLNSLFEVDIEDHWIRPYYHYKKAGFPDVCTCRENSTLLPDWYGDFNKGVSLHDDPVESATPDPLFFYTNSAQLHHLVVEWQVQAVDGQFYDILYAGSDTGSIYKFINTGTTQDQWTLVEDRPVFPGSPFAQLKMIEGSDGRPTHILASNYDKVVNVPLDLCQEHLTCQRCVATQDPHCSWAQGRCGTDLGEGIQNIALGTSTECPPENTGAAGAPSSEAKEAMYNATVLGLTAFGMFAGGILAGAGIACLIMYCQSVSRTPHLDKNLSQRHRVTYKDPSSEKLSHPFIPSSHHRLFDEQESQRYKAVMIRPNGEGAILANTDEEGNMPLEVGVAHDEPYGALFPSPSPCESDNTRPPSFDSIPVTTPSSHLQQPWGSAAGEASNC